MSYELTILSFEQKGLSLAEHSILNILAFRANEESECWPSINSLIENSSADRKTVIKILQSLYDKKLILKTGFFKGRTKRVPVYKLTLNNPKSGTFNFGNSPTFSINSPKTGTTKQSQKRDTEYKDLNDHKNACAHARSTPKEVSKDTAKHISGLLSILKNRS